MGHIKEPALNKDLSPLVTHHTFSSHTHSRSRAASKQTHTHTLSLSLSLSHTLFLTHTHTHTQFFPHTVCVRGYAGVYCVCVRCVCVCAQEQKSYRLPHRTFSGPVFGSGRAGSLSLSLSLSLSHTHIHPHTHTHTENIPQHDRNRTWYATSDNGLVTQNSGKEQRTVTSHFRRQPKHTEMVEDESNVPIAHRERPTTKHR